VNLGLRAIDNFIQRELFLSSGRWTLRPANLGTATSLSIDFEGRLFLSQIDAKNANLDLRGAISFTDSRVSSQAGSNFGLNRIARQVPISASLSADYKPKTLPLSFSANWTTKSASHWALPTSNSVSSTSGSILSAPERSAFSKIKHNLDVSALWRVNPQWSFRLSGNNLLAHLERRGETWVDPFNFGRFDQTEVLALPRTIRLQMELKL
jgi:outer membrane receptor protein involved in Fe transport